MPATSANLGPGFDALGLALALYNEVEAREADGVMVQVEGEGAERLPTSGDNLVARGVRLADDIVARSLATLDSVTPSGTSSLQRDIAAGKRSELEAWIGAVVRLGTAAGVATPVHDFLYASLLPLELRARGELSFG